MPGTPQLKRATTLTSPPVPAGCVPHQIGSRSRVPSSRSFVSIPFPKIRWPKIIRSYPLLKSLSHSFGLLCTAGMLPILLQKSWALPVGTPRPAYFQKWCAARAPDRGGRQFSQSMTYPVPVSCRIDFSYCLADNATVWNQIAPALNRPASIVSGRHAGNPKRVNLSCVPQSPGGCSRPWRLPAG